MALAKRIILFLAVNIAVVVLLTTITSVFGIAPYLGAYGLNLTSLAIFASIIGFSGAFISLLLSKKMAKWQMGVQVIENPNTRDEVFFQQVVQRIATQEGIKMPEIGIYQSPEINAFATGAGKNSALVAVSSGLLEQMDHDEVEGVIAHEMAHVLNGDMVTMTLVQGVVNTFVIFVARVAAYAIQNFITKGEETGGMVYYLISFILEIIFGILASTIVAAFSRWREFGADRGGAKYSSQAKMIKALQFLQNHQQMVNPADKGFQTMKISRPSSGIMMLFATHPPLEKRIEALKAIR